MAIPLGSAHPTLGGLMALPAPHRRVADVTTVLEESLSGIRIMRSFVREEYEAGRFGAGLHRFFIYLMKWRNYSSDYMIGAS